MKSNEKNPLVQGIVGVNPAANPGDYVTLWDLYFGQLAAQYVATEVAAKHPTERDQTIEEGLAIVASFTDQILESRNKAVATRFCHSDPDVVAVQARFRHAFETKSDKIILDDRESVAVMKWQVETPGHGKGSQLDNDLREYIQTGNLQLIRKNVHSSVWCGVPVMMSSFLYPDDDFQEEDDVADFDLKAFPSIMEFQELEKMIETWMDTPAPADHHFMSDREAVVFLQWIKTKQLLAVGADEVEADVLKFMDTGDLDLVAKHIHGGVFYDRTLMMTSRLNKAEAAS